MTNREHADAAWLELTKTTDSYPAWKRKGFPAGTHWAAARAHLDQITDVVAEPPAPPPPVTAPFAFRGIFCRDTEFDACYAHLDDLGVNVMGIWTSGTYNNALKRMNQLVAPHLRWTTIGLFTASTTGGTFNTTDAQVATIVQSIAQHPRNSHLYYIVDDTGNDMRSFTPAQRQLNLDRIKARVALIHLYDPLAIVSGSDYRPEQLQPGIWKGVHDEVVLDAYPSPNVDAAPDVIPNMAAWCDAVGMDYLISLSAHDYLGDRPSYPTELQFATMYAQARATRAHGVMLYTWYDAEGSVHLRDNPPPPLTGWATVKRQQLVMV